MTADAQQTTGFRCIAIETATAKGTVAACVGDHVFVVRLDTAQGSSRQIYQAVNEALERGSIERATLDCIAFGNGPGSFTGVRVATAAAQSLSFALGIPAVPVSSLAAVAVEAGRTLGAEPIAVCLDARMGEAYLGVYEFAADGTATPLLADRLVDPANFRLPDYGRPVTAAGPGWEAYPGLLEANLGTIDKQALSIWPGAAAIAVEARELFRQGRHVAPHQALPNYVRNKVTD